MLHLAIFSPGVIKRIFNGQKTIDGRFSKIKCAPYGLVQEGDLILMKKSGGKTKGYFVAGQVDYYNDLPAKKLQLIIDRYWDKLAIDKNFWDKKKNSSYFTFIEIKRPTKFRIPVNIKKKNLSGWLVLGGQSQNQIQLF